MGLFDHLNNITFKKVSWDTLDRIDRKSFNYYMINRFLSMEVDYLEYINYFQKYSSLLPDKCIYDLYMKFFPKRKLYNKYIKKKSDSKYSDVLYDAIQRRFCVSKSQANDYIEILDKDTMYNILIETGNDSKVSKKIIKSL